MTTRTTANDLDHLAEFINIILELPERTYEIGWAYGRPRLEQNGGSVDVSPRLPKPQLEQWMEAYIAGIDAGRNGRR